MADFIRIGERNSVVGVSEGASRREERRIDPSTTFTVKKAHKLQLQFQSLQIIIERATTTCRRNPPAVFYIHPPTPSKQTVVDAWMDINVYISKNT